MIVDSMHWYPLEELFPKIFDRSRDEVFSNFVWHWFDRWEEYFRKTMNSFDTKLKRIDQISSISLSSIHQNKFFLNLLDSYLNHRDNQFFHSFHWSIKSENLLYNSIHSTDFVNSSSFRFRIHPFRFIDHFNENISNISNHIHRLIDKWQGEFSIEKKNCYHFFFRLRLKIFVDKQFR